MNRKYPHFAIPEIYGESLSYYELLRKLVMAMNVMIDNYNTIPDQIDEAVANLDASKLFSAVLKQLINSIATDNTKSTNAVKVYKKHDLLYATFNETVKLYESLIDFTEGTETELIIGTNIREVNISELFIELRKLINDEVIVREQADNLLQQAINTERYAREQGDNTKVNKSDVLTLEEIQASSNLIGKVAGATGLKDVINILNNSINVPNAVAAGKEAIINNVKHVCSVIEPSQVRFSRIVNQGNGFVLGFSYEKTNDPPYAIFLYATIYSNILYVVRSNNHAWSVVSLIGSEL